MRSPVNKTSCISQSLSVTLFSEVWRKEITDFQHFRRINVVKITHKCQYINNRRKKNQRNKFTFSLLHSPHVSRCCLFILRVMPFYIWYYSILLSVQSSYFRFSTSLMPEEQTKCVHYQILYLRNFERSISPYHFLFHKDGLRCRMKQCPYF